MLRKLIKVFSFFRENWNPSLLIISEDKENNSNNQHDLLLDNVVRVKNFRIKSQENIATKACLFYQLLCITYLNWYLMVDLML